jgi:hypothetical protein
VGRLVPGRPWIQLASFCQVLAPVSTVPVIVCSWLRDRVQLADDQRDPDAKDKAGQHTLGQEIGDPAHLEQGESDVQDAGQQSDGSRQLHGLRGAPIGDRQHGRTDDGGEGWRGPGDHLSRTGKNGIDESSDARSVQTVLHGHAGDDSGGQGGRHPQGPY